MVSLATVAPASSGYVLAATSSEDRVALDGQLKWLVNLSQLLLTLPPSRAPALPQADNRHTIVLVQTTANKQSRTFLDYEKVSSAMDGERRTTPPAQPRSPEVRHPE
jgi:hypothetical protein